MHSSESLYKTGPDHSLCTHEMNMRTNGPHTKAKQSTRELRRGEGGEGESRTDVDLEVGALSPSGSFSTNQRSLALSRCFIGARPRAVLRAASSRPRRCQGDSDCLTQSLTRG